MGDVNTIVLQLVKAIGAKWCGRADANLLLAPAVWPAALLTQYSVSV
ncbi:MAG: hypothetical protein ABI632_00115 [Pseudolysinimonas sp.]